MKKSNFTQSPIVFALQQPESGVTVAEVCRKLGIRKYNREKGADDILTDFDSGSVEHKIPLVVLDHENAIDFFTRYPDKQIDAYFR